MLVKKRTAALGFAAVVVAAAIFGGIKTGESSTYAETAENAGAVVIAETAEAEGSAETVPATDVFDTAQEEKTIRYSRPEEEASYGPTGARERIDFNALEYRTEDESAPVVYFTDNISPEGLMNIYHMLGVTPQGNVGVKVSTGEAGNNHYLNPNLIKDLVWEVDGTIIETNTADVGGLRATTAMHYQVCADHGWTDLAKVDIMDEFGTTRLPVTGGQYLTEVEIGESLESYDFVLVLSHFKGHGIAGFGGALKNTAIGFSSPNGKLLIHSGGVGSPDGSFPSSSQEAFTSCMAEAAKTYFELFDNGNNILYINVMNNLSIDCDCIGTPAAPTMANVGILASRDPVALDQACMDIVHAAPDGGDITARVDALQGIHTLEHAVEIGFGSRNYRLDIIDE